jgi:tagatose 6-phosphate kinase
MILTVTLNPTVDKTYEVEKFVPGEVVRVKESRQAAAGKGIQVAKVAKLLGESVSATGYIGGHNGEYIKEFLEKAGISADFIQVEGETRTCINVKDLSSGRTTEILERGAPVPEKQQEEFLNNYKKLLVGCEIVAICGSVPSGIEKNVYVQLIKIAKDAGKTVLFDSSGELLAAGIKACPHVIKPNRDELAELIGRKITTKEEIVAAASEIRASGVENVIVSLGGDGAIFVTGDGVFQGTTPNIPIVNTVGCGDSLVAGFATGIRRGLPVEDKIKLAMAVSTANALHKETGFFLQSDLDKLLCMVDAVRL